LQRDTELTAQSELTVGLLTARLTERSCNAPLVVVYLQIFIPHLYLAFPQGVTPSEICKVFGAGKTRTIGLPYGKKNYKNMLSCFLESDTVMVKAVIPR